jgi:hypothetical protein
MEDFMLLVKGDNSDASPEQMQTKLQLYMVWMEKWKTTGNYIDGNPFKTEGHYLPDTKKVVKEGSFLNPSEVIGGYIHIQAKDINQATTIAQECPLLNGCGIFVRPFLKM